MNIMNDIVLICDDNYVMPTEVMIVSICNNWDSKEKATIHICAWSLSPKSIELFENLKCDKADIVIHIVDVNIYAEKIKKIHQNSHVTPTALLKFELPNIIPTVDKILYLDGDMVCKKDISTFIKIDLGNNYVGAVYDFWKFFGKRYDFNKKIDNDFYFNSGVMLLNLKAFRENNITDELWKCKLKEFNEDKKGKFGLMDQDAFNEVCKNKVMKLPIKYNCNCYFTKGIDVSYINNIYGVNYYSLDEMEKDALIIHYVGKDDKPWKYNNSLCQRYWDDYYIKTGRKLEELKRIEIKKDIKYYINKIKTSIDSRGVWNTLKYYFYKVCEGRS